MLNILYLHFIKLKASIRNYIKNPFKLVFLIFLAIIVALMFNATLSIEISDKAPFEQVLMIYLFSLLFFILINLVQTKIALVRKTDALYILSGPYSDKEVIFSGMLGSINGSLLISFMIVAYITLMTPYFDISALDILMMFIAGFLVFHIILGFVDFTYLFFKKAKHGKYARILLVALLVTSFGFSYFLYYRYGMGSFELRAFDAYLASEYVSYIPIIGSLRDLLLKLHYGQSFWLPLLILTSLDILIIIMTLRCKLDPERIIMDSIAIEELLKNRSKTKIKEKKNVKFKKGYLAITNRLMLDMYKSSNFISSKELSIIVVYIVIALFNREDITYYKYLMIVALSFFAGMANFNDELKHQYIYMMPISNIKKLIAIILPTLLKMLCISFVISIGGLIFRQDFNIILNLFLVLFGCSLSFVSVNILCLRFIGKDKIFNNFIRIGFTLLIIVITAFMDIWFMLEDSIILGGMISLLVNLILSAILLYSSANIFKVDVGFNIEEE